MERKRVAVIGGVLVEFYEDCGPGRHRPQRAKRGGALGAPLRPTIKGRPAVGLEPMMWHVAQCPALVPGEMAVDGPDGTQREPAPKKPRKRRYVPWWDAR